eukprot:COSAG06_NODE_4609_length_4102_cov_63.784911_5_plen_78_part_00
MAAGTGGDAGRSGGTLERRTRSDRCLMNLAAETVGQGRREMRKVLLVISPLVLFSNVVNSSVFMSAVLAAADRSAVQ